MAENRTIWVITEGLIGTENQCVGIAQALGGALTTKRILLNFPWALISPFCAWGEGPQMLAPGSDPIAPPWPDVLIAGGRKAIGIARYIKKASGGRTLTCVVQNPHVNLGTFDLVAVPYHDNITGPNVIVTDGAPGRITPDLLAAAREKWHDLIAPLPAPRVAVLIGGNSRTHKLGPSEMDALIARLLDLHAKEKASLMITISRRTPADLVTRLSASCRGTGALIYTGIGENPYHGFLAWADRIICTNDSTSMISDAATTGKPIEIFPLRGTSRRSVRFLAHLKDLGVIGNKTPASYTPFCDSARVAQKIQEMLEQRKRN